MQVSLANGKTIDLPVDILFYSDKDYALYMQALMAANAGEEVENAFKHSSLDEINSQKIDEEDEGFPDDEVLLTRDDI